jgi:mycofactocin system glycosyltransferase
MTIPPAPAAPAPGGLRVALVADVGVRDGGRVLVGGSPFRVMRLTEAGARTVAGWQAPAPVGEQPAHRDLARRLLDAGILSAEPGPAAPTPELAVVVPVRDRPVELARCLDSVAASCPASPVVVVDDGSADPAAIEAVCLARGARVIRHDASRGPAAARNSGMAACTTPLVAFVDSDVVMPEGCADALLGHFLDPCIAAVAPRIRALPPSRGPIGRYEERHSALDMGAGRGLVAPGRPISYVPSAALIVRRSAVGGGFDESLRVGEDVDLVWRLWRAGWRVSYEPRAHVWHDHRVRFREWVSRRRVYAGSIGSLALRHPDALPATRVSPWMAAPWAFFLTGHHRIALAGAAVEAALLSRRLKGSPDDRYRLASALVSRGLLATGLGLAHAVRRAWAPPLLLLGRRRTTLRRVVLASFAAPLIQDALATREPRAVLADAPIRLLDEAVALAGTWEGCIRHRTVRPLLPTWRQAAARREA